MTRSGSVAIRVTCPIAARATARLSVGSKAISGRKSFSVRTGRSKTVKLKLNRKGRRLVRRHNRLSARVTVISRARGAKSSHRVRATRRITIKEAKHKGRKR
jgi:hypothetical protein